MAWDNAVITNAGLSLYLEGLSENGLVISNKAKGGSSTYPVASLMAQTEITSPQLPIDVIRISDFAHGKQVDMRITNQGVQTSYSIKQIGIIAKKPGGSEKLLAIIQDETGVKIPTISENPEFVFEFGFLLPFANELQLTLEINPTVLVTFDDISDMIEHMQNKNNPHGVTAAQVGADSAGSAATVQANLNTHIADKNNPHAVTASQVGADPSGSAAAVQASLAVVAKTGNYNDLSNKPAIPTAVTVENVLTSTSTVNALSAAQGKALNDGKAPIGHVGAGGTAQHPLGNGTTPGFSTNDYTAAEKTKLSGITAGATANTVENVLTSTSTVNALSAAQGKALNDGKQAVIAAGTTAQYWRGDKTWQTLDKAAVGLGNVPNTDATNASNASSGTLADARLSTNVVLLNSAQTISGAKTFTGNIVANSKTVTPAQLGYLANLKIITSTLEGDGIGFGTGAMINNASSAGKNTAFGIDALRNNTSGFNGTAIGWGALNANQTNPYNTAVGAYALFAKTTGGNNTAVGYEAGKYIGTGYTDLTSVTNSIFIGYSTRASANGNTNETVIGYNAVGGGSNTITLGNTDVTQIRAKVTSITSTSDKRTKEDIELANNDMCYDAVKNLPVSRYKYKDFMGESVDKHVTGFIADDVMKIFPKSVTTLDRSFPVLDESGNKIYEEIVDTIIEINEDGKEVTKEITREVEKTFLIEDCKELTMTEFLPTLWGAVQSLISKVELLEAQIAGL